jgi:hypothetical protein
LLFFLEEQDGGILCGGDLVFIEEFRSLSGISGYIFKGNYLVDSHASHDGKAPNTSHPPLIE